MPNWCENDLMVSGPTARVRDFLVFASSETTLFDFDRFIPYPEEWAAKDRVWEAWLADPNPTGEMPSDGFNAGGYEWCVERWGTKWNACRVNVGDATECGGELSAALHFDTAWSPPRPVILKASELFPDLRFDLRYFEGRGGFCGTCICEGGSVTRDDTRPYSGNRGG